MTMLKLRLLSCLLCIGLIPVSGAQADIENVAVVSLRLVNSPSAAGMGNCALNTVNEESAHYNPGTIGLLHFDKLVAVSLPHTTEWVPQVADDLPFKSWNGSVGSSYRFLKGDDGRFNVSLGLAYSYSKFSLGTFERTDPFGNHVGSFESYDEVKSYALSVGVEYHARLGIGYATKKIKSVLADYGAGIELESGTAEGDATDIGLLLELPIHRMLPGGIVLQDTGERQMALRLTPSFAIVVANDGDDIAYIDAAQTDPLPKTQKIGVALAAAVDLDRREILFARFHSEKETLKIGSEPKDDRWGVELGAFGAGYVRLGSFENGNLPTLSTFGFGFRLSGALDWLNVQYRFAESGSVLHYLTEHLDVAFDYARWKENDDLSTSNTKFWRVALSF